MEDNFFNDPSASQSGDSASKPKNIHQAIVAYIPFLCFISLFGKETDEYSRQHGRQGLLLLIAELLAVFMLLPIGAFFWKLVLIACLVGAIAGIVAAYTGKSFTLPFIGRWADKL